MGETTQEERGLYRDATYPGGKPALIGRFARDADRLAQAEALLRECTNRIGPVDASGSLQARIDSFLSNGGG